MKSRNVMAEKLKAIDFKRFNMLAHKIAERNNKSVAYVKMDMIYNFLKYKTGYTDYFKSDYINLTKKQKEDFLTTGNFFNIIEYLNPRKYRVVTTDKIVFNKILSKYLKRDFMDLRIAATEDIKKFIKGKKNVVIKPCTDFGGHGVERISVKDIKNVEEFQKKCLKNKQYLLEEEIIQHEEMNKLNPNAVCTLRINTLYKDGKSYVVARALRINLDDSFALCCKDGDARVDEKGNIVSDFIDDDGISYEKHPTTNYNLKEFKKIPFVPEADKMVMEAALQIPDIRYVGWDVAITPTGPCVIEGNEYPSYGLIQNFMMDEANPGHLKTIRDILGDEMKNIKLNK